MFNIFKTKKRLERVSPKIGENDKVLIIGARGNLGSQLFNRLGNMYRLVAWDREDIDITDKPEVRKKILAIKPHIIINAAAYNSVDKCEEDDQEFELAKKLNGVAVGYLADVALELGAIFIHYSTNYVFSGENESGYQEDDEPRPISRYAESKLMGEKEVLKRKDRGLKYYLIRSSKLFGPKGKSRLTKPSFFDIMLRLAKEKDSVDLVDEEVSNFTYTPDLAQATEELIAGKYEWGIYHIVNQGAVTWYQAAQELFKLANVKVQVRPVSGDKFPRPAPRPAFAKLINTKLPHLRHYRSALKAYLNNQS